MPRRLAAGRRLLITALALSGSVLIAVGGARAVEHRRPAAAAVGSPDWGDPSAALAPPGHRSSPATSLERASSGAGHGPAQPVPAGSRLTLTRLQVNAGIVRVGAPAGIMTVPRDPHMVGWWAQGVPPGSSAGSAVIVGHVNYAGVTGALGALPHARAGDRVVITERGQQIRYAVTAVRTYPKTSGIPADAFRRTGPPRLVLITCGGPFDPATGNYLDNIVAYAEPLESA